MQFVADLERGDDGALQIMYGLGGERDLTERELDRLSGYEESAPVRVGNGAFTQRQNDVFGAVLDSVYLHTKMDGHIPQRLWPVLHDQVRSAIAVWGKPDQGIWEARGEPKHYVSSKLMCWVAVDRAARLAEMQGESARWPPSGARSPNGSAQDILAPRRVGARRVPPALRHRRARRLDAADPAGALPARPTTSGCARPCWRSPTS